MQLAGYKYLTVTGRYHTRQDGEWEVLYNRVLNMGRYILSMDTLLDTLPYKILTKAKQRRKDWATLVRYLQILYKALEHLATAQMIIV